MANLNENDFIVHHRYFLCGSLVFWVMGWLCLYFTGTDMYSYADNFLSHLFFILLFVLLFFGGPLSAIFLYSWKIEIKDNNLIAEKFWGRIRKEYSFDEDFKKRIELKSNGSIKIKFDDKITLTVDALAVGYRKLKQYLEL